MECGNMKTPTLEYIDNRSAGEKYHEIAEQSLENEPEIKHYVEIIKQENGKVTTRLVNATVLTEMENGTMVPLVDIDLRNYKVLRTTDVQDVGEMDIANIDIQITDQQHEDGFQTIDENGVQKSITTSKDNSNELEETQYIQVVEKDSVPLVFYASKPQSEMCGAKKRKKYDSEVYIPKELMESPTFKAYIYPCKQCDFKCNAIKELTAHRVEKHTRSRHVGLAANRIPSNNVSVPIWNTLKLVNKTCTICDFTTTSKYVFKKHLMKEHGIKLFENEEALGIQVPCSTKAAGKFQCPSCRFETKHKSVFSTHVCGKDDDDDKEDSN